MTTPAGLPTSSRLSADDVKTLVAAVTENAHRLGLKWLIRPGTITAGGDASNISVKVDGDDVATVGVASMIGQLIAGARVYLLIVPMVGTYVIGRVGSQMQNLIERHYTRASGSLTLDATATLIPGCTITIEIGDFEYDVTGVFDMDETGAGTSIGVGELFIDGVVASGAIAVFEMTTVNHRATVTQQWSGSVAGGSQHVFELRGRRSAVSGTQVINQAGTTMRMMIYR